MVRKGQGSGLQEKDCRNCLSGATFRTAVNNKIGELVLVVLELFTVLSLFKSSARP